ncbi:TRADD-N-associated membrane domain-containing protein [Nonomuraea insulae]|uniref:Cyanobacterial TRADD-N associated 2 transmembrane domain-containing protein n=1 Tax=Nonomuraea insulae TaxID=1616787 RepID=A0ABW1D3L1_9ACTN
MIVSVMVMVMMLGFYDYLNTKSVNSLRLFMGIPAIILAVLALVITARRRQEKNERREEALRELRSAEGALKSSDRLELGKLWTTTQSRLNYYHELATDHAQQSFRNAQIAACTGFALLLTFAIIAVYADDPQSTIVSGVLGAIAAALAGYIGRTFIRSQESAASHLHAYFDQPVKFSRYLAAERLIAEMMALQPEQRAAISGELLRTIIAPDVFSGTSSSGGTSPPPVPAPSVPPPSGMPNGHNQHRRLHWPFLGRM